VPRGTATAPLGAYGDIQIGLTISFTPLPEIGWSGTHHIGGRVTSITRPFFVHSFALPRPDRARTAAELVPIAGCYGRLVHAQEGPMLCNEAQPGMHRLLDRGYAARHTTARILVPRLGYGERL
jgi:hypothetical protein